MYSRVGTSSLSPHVLLGPLDASSQRLSVGFGSSPNSARGLQTRAHVPQGPAQRALQGPQCEVHCQTRQSRPSPRPADRSTEQPGRTTQHVLQFRAYVPFPSTLFLKTLVLKVQLQHALESCGFVGTRRRCCGNLTLVCIY